MTPSAFVVIMLTRRLFCDYKHLMMIMYGVHRRSELMLSSVGEKYLQYGQTNYTRLFAWTILNF